jgi:hypothetical protein
MVVPGEPFNLGKVKGENPLIFHEKEASLPVGFLFMEIFHRFSSFPKS